MNLYPAIDILDGRAVRLRQGRRDDVTDYGSPLAMAQQWSVQGASWLHVVDLNGAFAGEPVNIEAIEQIRTACPGVRMQVGGGIRNLPAMQRLFSAGVDRVILGTAAVSDPELVDEAIAAFGERVAVGIDARDGTVRLNGWTRDAGLAAVDLAAQLERKGVRRVIYTDIARDGLLGGVNVDATERLIEATDLQVIASGGVSSRQDIERLVALAHERLDGAIIGKALYEGTVDLREALSVAGAPNAG